MALRTDVTLYLGNIPFKATEAQLASFVAEVGDPISIRIIKDRDTGLPRGFAFVHLAMHEGKPPDAWELLDQRTMDSRVVNVRLANPDVKGNMNRRVG
jgi:hypothetical protein